MKKHSSLYWRKSDPSHYRFALPNSIWRYGLKPKSFTILCYLSYRQAHGNDAPTTLAQIVSGVHMSKKVVKKNLDVLRSAGLVNGDGALTDAVTDLTAGFFSLSNEVFLLNLSPGAISVYAYLLCCEDWRARKCHPSYKTICTHTRMSVSSAEKYVTELVDKRLIAVEHSHYFRYGHKRISNNLYTILPVCGALNSHYQRHHAHGIGKVAASEPLDLVLLLPVKGVHNSHPQPSAQIEPCHQEGGWDVGQQKFGAGNVKGVKAYRRQSIQDRGLVFCSS